MKSRLNFLRMVVMLEKIIYKHKIFSFEPITERIIKAIDYACRKSQKFTDVKLIVRKPIDLYSVLCQICQSSKNESRESYAKAFEEIQEIWKVLKYYKQIIDSKQLCQRNKSNCLNSIKKHMYDTYGEEW